MRTGDLYDYALLRVVPRVEREEFVNAGVLLSCPTRRVLIARIGLDVPRLLALDPTVDVETVQRQLEAIVAICEGRDGSGPIGALPVRARFHWLTAKRSALIQPSPVHTGRCTTPEAMADHLFDRMVRTPG
ncbi:MAG TPA: DUF3037 domain-containing protein [Lysobacter sp.]|nr:DUF3037 domain-containing protein [Lysobacter sp.]